MLSFLIGQAKMGDNANPWLIAVCMIVSILVIIALFILGQKGKDEEEAEDDE